MTREKSGRFAAALCAALCVILSACGSGGEKKKAGGESSPVSAITVPNDDADPGAKKTGVENGAPVTADSLKPEKDRTVGVDVSKWQGKIDWARVKAAGIAFACIRVGYRGEDGLIYRDETADYNIQQAEKAGLLIGAYFFSTAVNAEEAEEEAKWTVDAVAGYPVSYPVVYDCEGFREPGSRMNGLSADRRTANAVRFLETVEKAGYGGMLYGAKNELRNDYYWDIGKIGQKYKIWLAYYPTPTYPEVTVPDYSDRYDMWQFTNRGAVPGIEGDVDMAVCYFKAEKKAAKNPEKRPAEAQAPLSAEEKRFSAVNETVTAKERTNLRASATTKSEVVGVLENGQTAKRVGVNADTGWSKLEWEGKTVYAITSYLTTDLSYRPPSKGDGFTAVNEPVTAKEETNLRDAPSLENSKVVHTLENGEILYRTGINGATGWSKLEWEGKTVYAVTSYLTTDLSYKPAPQSDGFAPADGRVTAKEETNLRDAPKVEGSKVVHTLKKGEYARRTGINENSGWTRLEWEGQTVYAITSYLTENAG